MNSKYKTEDCFAEPRNDICFIFNFKQLLRESNEQNLKVLATREDVSAVKGDILKLREDMAKQETRLSQTIYIVGVAQFLAIVASVFALIKYAH